MQIAICDDEQSCIKRLYTLIQAYCTDRRLTCELSVFTDPVAFQTSGMENYDVVFLDANMGEINGIEAAKALRGVNKSAVLVYVSAFVEYAPMGYAVDAFRYLMKHELDDIFTDSMDEIIGRVEMNSKRLSLVTTDGEQMVVISELVFIESFRHQILFHLEDSTILESKQYTLTGLTSLLEAHSFLRIHKSYLVNPKHIVMMKSRAVTLDNGKTLNCGKRDYAEILRSFMLWKGGMLLFVNAAFILQYIIKMADFNLQL